MNSLVVLLVLMCSFVGPSYQILCSKSCSVNETFSHCEAGAGECQKTCLTRDHFESLGCACNAGCICKNGYVKDANTYRCILIEDCPSLPVPKNSCPRNEIYSESGAGCQKNCYTQNLMYKCIPKAGCVCKAGYIRSPINNKCILISSCEKCPSDYTNSTETGRCVLSCNECQDPKAEFIQCASSCQPSCEKPFIGICNRRCNAVCVCKPGYIENARGKCILPEECSKPKCPANELLSCRNPTCDDEGCFKMGRKCDDVPCQIKCYCKDGFVRIDGKCVPRIQCMSPVDPIVVIDPIIFVDCIPNAQYSQCGSSCAQLTCDDPTKTNVACPYLCEEGCFCLKDYYMNSVGQCVLLEDCTGTKVQSIRPMVIGPVSQNLTILMMELQ